MPINLKPVEVSDTLAGVRSVLIVYCPICPQISLAMHEDGPWLSLMKSGLKTPALEGLIRAIRDPLEDRGVRADVFTMRMPIPMMCLWTKGQRERLRKQATGYEAVLVLGCDSAAFTAEQVLEGTGCRVILGMKMVGITNATVTHRFPLTYELDEPTRVPIGQVGGQTRDD